MPKYDMGYMTIVRITKRGCLETFVGYYETEEQAYKHIKAERIYYQDLFYDACVVWYDVRQDCEFN